MRYCLLAIQYSILLYYTAALHTVKQYLDALIIITELNPGVLGVKVVLYSTVSALCTPRAALSLFSPPEIEFH